MFENFWLHTKIPDLSGIPDFNFQNDDPLESSWDRSNLHPFTFFLKIKWKCRTSVQGVYTTAGLFRMTMILGCSSIDCFTSSHHLFFCCSYCMLEFQIYPEFCDFWVQNDVHNRENIFMLFCGQGVIFRMCANKTIVYAKVWCFAELQSLFFMGLSYWKICAPPLEKVCRRCGQSGDQWRRHTFQSGRAGGGTQLIRKSIKRSKSGSAQHP